MRCKRFDKPHAHVAFDGRFMGIKRWNIKIVDGVIVHGMAYGGTVTGWIKYGSLNRAATFAGRKLVEYRYDISRL